jgi:hypothetical protein
MVYDESIDPSNDYMARILADNASFFSIADAVQEVALELFPFDTHALLDTEITNAVQRLLLALYTQAYRLYRSIIILCKAGADKESMILLRSLLDTASYLLYISEKDHSKRYLEYIHSRSLSQEVAIRDFIETYPKYSAFINLQHAEARKEAAIAYFRETHRSNEEARDIKRKYALRPDIAAQEIEDKTLSKHFCTMHRFASSLCHGENLPEYIEIGTEVDEYLLAVDPSESYVKFCIADATILFLKMMRSLNRALGLGQSSVIDGLDERLALFIEEQGPQIKIDFSQ